MWEKLDKIKWKLLIITGIIGAIIYLGGLTNVHIIKPLKNYLQFQDDIKKSFQDIKEITRNLKERNLVNSGILQSTLMRFDTIQYKARVAIIDEDRNIVEEKIIPIKLYVTRSGDMYGWIRDKGINEGESQYVVDYQKSEWKMRYMDFNGNRIWIEPPISPENYKRKIKEVCESYHRN